MGHARSRAYPPDSRAGARAQTPGRRRRTGKVLPIEAMISRRLLPALAFCRDPGAQTFIKTSTRARDVYEKRRLRASNRDCGPALHGAWSNAVITYSPFRPTSPQQTAHAAIPPETGLAFEHPWPVYLLKVYVGAIRSGAAPAARWAH